MVRKANLIVSFFFLSQNSKVKSQKGGRREYRKERKEGKGRKEEPEPTLRPLPPLRSLRYSRLPNNTKY